MTPKRETIPMMQPPTNMAAAGHLWEEPHGPCSILRYIEHGRRKIKVTELVQPTRPNTYRSTKEREGGRERRHELISALLPYTDGE